MADFGRRRVGIEATETFLDPFVTGIHAGDVERLSMESAFPRIAGLEKEHGSLFRGMIHMRRERHRRGGGARGAGGRLRSFPGGLEELAAALEKRLGERVVLNRTAESIQPQEEHLEVRYREGSAERGEAVVVALPAPRAASLFSVSRPELARALEALPYAPVAVVCLGYRREDVEHALDGFGFLVPRNQRRRILGTIWTSSVFSEHAPGDLVSLRTLLGGARDPDVVDRPADELVGLVEREAGPLLGLRGEPVVRKVYRYAQGIPQYNLGHARRLERIEGERRRVRGLFLAGNAYRGVGINDCVREAARVSAEVLAFLGAGGAELP